MLGLSLKPSTKRKAVPRGALDGKAHIEGVPDELAIEIDRDGSPVSMKPAEWFVCFVPGLQKQWWHSFTDPRHKHVFALRMVGDDHWILFEPWWTRIMNTMLTLDEAVKFLRWGGVGSVLRVQESIPGIGSQTRGWANCAVLVSLLLGRSYWTWTPHGLYQALSREEGVETVDVPAFLEGHLACVAQRQAEIAVGTLQAVEDRPVEVLLRDAGVRICTMMTSEVALGIYRVAVSEAFHFPTASEAFFETGPTRVLASIEALLSHAQQKGELGAVDVRVCAKQFLAMLRGNLHLEIIFGCRGTPTADEIKERVDSVVDVILHGIGAKSCDWTVPVSAGRPSQ